MPRKPAPSRDGFNAHWRARFVRYALLHDDDAGVAGWSATGLRARFRFFAGRWSPPRAGGRWLDVGCGAGTYTRHLSAAGQEAVGVDYSVPSLRKARARDPGHATWVAGDARALPFPGGTADGVLCFGVTQALGESGPVVRELVRLLDRDGELWIDGLNAWCLPHLWERLRRRLRRQPPHLHYESPRRLQRLVRDAGMAEVRLLWLPILPGRLQRWQGWLEHPAVVRLLHGVPGLGALVSHSVVVVATGRTP